MERRCRAGGFAGEPLIFLLLRLMHPALLNRAHENEVFPSTGGEQRHRGQSRASHAPWPPLVQTPWSHSKGSHWLRFCVSLLLNSSWRCSPGWERWDRVSTGRWVMVWPFSKHPLPRTPCGTWTDGQTAEALMSLALPVLRFWEGDKEGSQPVVLFKQDLRRATCGAAVPVAGREHPFHLPHLKPCCRAACGTAQHREHPNALYSSHNGKHIKGCYA